MKNVRTSGAHCQKLCAHRWKWAPRAPGVPLISNSGGVMSLYGEHALNLSKFRAKLVNSITDQEITLLFQNQFNYPVAVGTP